MYETVSPEDLLQVANSLKTDVFQIFFETLAEHKVDPEPYRSYLRGTVPPYYQQDLDQAFIPAGAVAATDKSAPTNRKQVPGK